MMLAPEHRPELLAMREEVKRLFDEQHEAFLHSETNTVNTVRYDVALQRYVRAKIAYEAALKDAMDAYDNSQPRHIEVSYGQPF